jgi:hypothetical protein
MSTVNEPYVKHFNSNGVLTNPIIGVYFCGYTDPNGVSRVYPNRKQRRDFMKFSRKRGAATNGIKGYTINPIPVRKRK